MGKDNLHKGQALAIWSTLASFLRVVVPLLEGQCWDIVAVGARVSKGLRAHVVAQRLSVLFAPQVGPLPWFSRFLVRVVFSISPQPWAGLLCRLRQTIGLWS